MTALGRNIGLLHVRLTVQHGSKPMGTLATTLIGGPTTRPATNIRFLLVKSEYSIVKITTPNRIAFLTSYIPGLKSIAVKGFQLSRGNGVLEQMDRRADGRTDR